MHVENPIKVLPEFSIECRQQLSLESWLDQGVIIIIDLYYQEIVLCQWIEIQNVSCKASCFHIVVPASC